MKTKRMKMKAHDVKLVVKWDGGSLIWETKVPAESYEEAVGVAREKAMMKIVTEMVSTIPPKKG